MSFVEFLQFALETLLSVYGVRVGLAHEDHIIQNIQDYSTLKEKRKNGVAITLCDVIKELRIKLPILESIVSMSPEKRETILPVGVVSKYVCGNLTTLLRSSLCSFFAACRTPTCTRKDPKYNAKAVYEQS